MKKLLASVVISILALFALPVVANAQDVPPIYHRDTYGTQNNNVVTSYTSWWAANCQVQYQQGEFWTIPYGKISVTSIPQTNHCYARVCMTWSNNGYLSSQCTNWSSDISGNWVSATGPQYGDCQWVTYNIQRTYGNYSYQENRQINC